MGNYQSHVNKSRVKESGNIVKSVTMQTYINRDTIKDNAENHVITEGDKMFIKSFITLDLFNIIGCSFLFIIF